MFGACEVILKYSGKYAESLILSLPSLSMRLLTSSVLLRGRAEGGIFFNGALSLFFLSLDVGSFSNDTFFFLFSFLRGLLSSSEDSSSVSESSEMFWEDSLLSESGSLSNRDGSKICSAASIIILTGNGMVSDKFGSTWNTRASKCFQMCCGNPIQNAFRY